MKKINKKLLLGLSFVATPFIAEVFTENTATANNQYTLHNNTQTYKTASNAATKNLATSTYAKGNYYIYKQSNGMLNISKTPGKPGAWINPSTNIAPTQDLVTKTQSVNVQNPQLGTSQNGAILTITSPINVYKTAADASRKVGSTNTYPNGTYYVYKNYNGMLNISRTPGKVGAWINPSEVQVGNVPPKNENTSENRQNFSNEQNQQNLPVVNGQYTLNKNTKVYSTAVLASQGRGSNRTYEVGNYYIYKIHNGMLNISKVQGRAGAWINPNENGTTSGTPVNSTSTNKTQVNVGDLSRYSDKRFSWSWNYPSTEALNILRANNGLYKYNTNNKEVYLTFDNGYEAGHTAKILDTLRNNNVKVVFFVTGEYIRDNLSLVKRMEAEGHIVANHTLRHYDASKVSAWTVAQDIKDWETTYTQYMGKAPSTNLYRPATGTFSERTVKGAASHGYKLVQWSYAYRDWDENNQPPVATSRNNLIKNSKPGDIVLLHSVSRTNRDLLDGYIKEMKARGFDFKQVR